MEDYHSIQDVIPSFAFTPDIDYEKSDYKVFGYHPSKLKEFSEQLKESEVEWYRTKYGLTKNDFMKCIYYCILRWNKYYQKYRLKHLKEVLDLFPKVIIALIQKTYHYNNIQYASFFFTEFVDSAFQLKNWQEIFERGTELLIEIETLSYPDYSNNLTYLIKQNPKKTMINYPPELDELIDRWFEKFDGNFTRIPFNKIDIFLSFYQKKGMMDKVESIKKDVFSKIMDSFKRGFESETFDETNAQSLGVKTHFLEIKLKVLEKYTTENREELMNAVKIELDRVSKMFSKCSSGFLSQTLSTKISINKETFEYFKKNLDEFLLSLQNNVDFFPPVVENDPKADPLLNLVGKKIFSEVGRIKNIPGAESKISDGSFDENMITQNSWVYYENRLRFAMDYFIRLIHSYNLIEFFSKIYHTLGKSTIISPATKNLYIGAINSYLNQDYKNTIYQLIFQFEDILKNLCNHKGFSLRIVEKSGQRDSSYSKIIKIITENQLIEDNYLVFLKWFLTDEKGQPSKNYRNLIAHGLSTESQIIQIFNQQNALCCLLLVFLLSKYGY